MLNTWKKCYFEVRGKIEASGRDQRWEFDRRKLFERTDYMSNICEDLYNVAQVREKYKQTNKKKEYEPKLWDKSAIYLPFLQMGTFFQFCKFQFVCLNIIPSKVESIAQGKNLFAWEFQVLIRRKKSILANSTDSE